MSTPPTPKMIAALKRVGDSTVTGFGYNNAPAGPRYLNANTVHALIGRGLLEDAGTMVWHAENDRVRIFRLSDAGKQVVQSTQEINV